MALPKLYKNDKGLSESLRDVVNEITQLASYLASVDSLRERGLYYVDDPQYFNATVPNQP